MMYVEMFLNVCRMYVEINQRDLKKGSEKDFCNIEGDIWDDFKRDPHFVSLTFADLL